MPDHTPTVVLSTDAERNAVTMYDVDRVTTARTNKEGRLYLSRGLSGEHVEFAVKRGGMVASGDRDDEPGDGDDVVLHDVELLTTKRVLGNGHLHLGAAYQDVEVTVALSVVEAPEDVEEQHANQQTAGS